MPTSRSQDVACARHNGPFFGTRQCHRFNGETKENCPLTFYIIANEILTIVCWCNYSSDNKGDSSSRGSSSRGSRGQGQQQQGAATAAAVGQRIQTVVAPQQLVLTRDGCEQRVVNVRPWHNNKNNNWINYVVRSHRTVLLMYDGLWTNACTKRTTDKAFPKRRISRSWK